MHNTIITDLKFANSNLEFFDSKDVEIIGVNAFINCWQLKKVILRKNVRLLGSGAFKNCNNLKTVEIDKDSKIPFIPNECFKNCHSLENIKLPKYTIDISTSAFKNCTKLEKIDITASTINIDDDAFIDCLALQEIDGADSITKIGNNAFSNCKNLQMLSAKNCLHIGEKAFKDCECLEKIQLNIDMISQWCFQNCFSLSTIENYREIKSIEEFAFLNCKNIKYISAVSNDCIFLDFSLCDVDSFQFNRKFDFYQDCKSNCNEHAMSIKINNKNFTIYV